VEKVLEGIAGESEQRIRDLKVLSREEEEQQLVEWNETSREYGREESLQQRFERQVGLSPERVAVRFGGEEISYGALNKRANQLAHYLQKAGVGAEDLVGVLCERSIEMVIAILGIIKAGGAYLPLDSAYPQERLAFMLQDGAVKVVLAEQKLIAVLGEVAKTEVISLESLSEELQAEAEENPEVITSGENLAYVIYTG
jgi:non-ribosomal peptide synthetase component F